MIRHSLGISCLRHFTDVHLPLIAYAGNFVTWLVFFVLGLCLRKSDVVSLSNKQLVLLTLLLYLLSCLETFAVSAIFHETANAVSAIKTSSFLYSFFLIVLLFKNKNLNENKFLRLLGEASFGMFLIHMFVLSAVYAGIEIAMPQLKYIQPILQLLQVGAVSLICFFIVKFVNKIAPIKLRTAIGFK